MPVSFESYTPATGHKEKDVPTEYVRIGRAPPPPPPADEVFRRATDEDRARYAAEYAAFKGTAKAAPTPEAPASATSGFFGTKRKDK